MPISTVGHAASFGSAPVLDSVGFLHDANATSGGLAPSDRPDFAILGKKSRNGELMDITSEKPHPVARADGERKFL